MQVLKAVARRVMLELKVTLFESSPHKSTASNVCCVPIIKIGAAHTSCHGAGLQAPEPSEGGAKGGGNNLAFSPILLERNAKGEKVKANPGKPMRRKGRKTSQNRKVCSRSALASRKL